MNIGGYLRKLIRILETDLYIYIADIYISAISASLNKFITHAGKNDK